MKKRILSVLLVLAMLASLTVMPTYAAETGSDNTTALTEECPCGCGKTLQQVTWREWDGDPNSGHYYLPGDFSHAEELSVISGNSVVLDLRGYTLTCTAKERLFTVNGYLGILDSVGGGRLTSRTAGTYNGGIIRIADNETAGSLVELYSGTITPSADAAQSHGGGLIGLGDGATFRMYGGMLLNGNAKGSGGAIHAESSTTTVEILGGSIVGCKATGSGGAIYSAGATILLKDCEIIGNSGSSGGNISQSAGSLTIENCTIAGGVSDTTNKYGGGNISVTGNGKINITDSLIYGGYTLSNGGNLSLGYSTTVIKNTKIYGGTCEGMGANIALPVSSAKVTLDGCTVDGGMDNVMGTLTLKGATKIALTNGGLDLSEQTKSTTASGLSAGAEVYISGNGKTVTGGAAYIKPALRSSLTVSGSNATVNVAADGVTAGYCPHCNTQVAWQPYGTANATHTYLTADLADFAEVTVASTLVIDTAGFDITATGRAFNVTAEGDLAIIDSAGGSIITGSGVNEAFGGIIANAGAAKLYGGKYVFQAADGVTPAGGAILSNDKHLTFYNVIMDASAFENTSAGKGGAIYQAAATTQGEKTITAVGGRILGGNAYSGGGIFVDHKGQTNLEAVNFFDGEAASVGGNIYTYGSGTTITAELNMTGCVISGGSAQQHSGNVFVSRHNATLKNCYVTGGEVTDEDGGNLYSGVRGNLMAENCIITDGTARKGGNVMIAQSNGKGTLTNCLILNGTGKDVSSVSGNGGNVSVYRGILTIDGGTIAHGTATTGGNVHVATTTSPGLTIQGAPKFWNGTATTGGNLCVTGIVDMQGGSFASGAAEAGNDLYISGSAAALTLGTGVTGNVQMNAAAGLLTEEVYGGAVSGITCKAEDATIVLDGKYGNCGTLINNETIYVATTAVVDSEGNAVWYSSNADAVAACGENSYVKLFTGNDLLLTKDLYADLNGNTVNVSGDYTLYGMDASGDSYSIPTGTATGVTVGAVTYAPNGKTYIADTVEGVTTFHRLDMKITSVNIRPSVDGIYYTAKWYCDDTLKGKIASYGVVASTVDMPDSNFAADGDNLWTTFGKDGFVSGQAQNGAVIAGILKADGRTAAENSANGKKDIYAKAYMTFTDGTSYISADNVGFSLYEVMKSLDKLIMEKPIQYRKYNLTARNFYEKWKDSGMGGWTLNKIPKPADDGVIDVLMVGSSFCYYYVEELYALGQAAGIDIRVCNLYYSGCPLEKHYKWWANGNSNYQYYETYHDGRKLTSNVSLEWGLAQHEWDVISLQESSSDTVEDGAENHYNSEKKYWEPLISYFDEQFPDTKLLWQSPWTNQLVHGKEGTIVHSAEDQEKYVTEIEVFVDKICDYYNDGKEETVLQIVPSGRAWQNTRNAGYDFLTCRLTKTNPVTGVAHAGDGYHDGDIGGGQYLNACVWFEIITGKSVVGNSYIPEYATTATLSDELLGQVRVEKTENGYALTSELVALLQQSAHDAVAAWGVTVE